MAKKKKNIHEPSPKVNEPITDYGQGHESLTFEKVWLMFKETDRQFKETDKQFKETGKQFQETDKRFKETDKKIERLSNLFTTQWGKLMEALITPSCLKLFKERGIDISRTYTNIKVEKEDLEGEFDIVLANGDEVVVVEVKTTMTPTYVNEFLEKLKKIREYLPEHKNKKVYCAVAGIKYESASDKYAFRNGLFVLINKGEDNIKIANKRDFVPARF